MGNSIRCFLDGSLSFWSIHWICFWRQIDYYRFAAYVTSYPLEMMIYRERINEVHIKTNVRN